MKFIDLIQETRKNASSWENRPLPRAKRWLGICRWPVKISGARRFAFGCVLAFAAMDSAPAATLTVTGTGDTIAVDGLVTLREAITSANNDANVNADVVAVGAYGTDTIKFNIPGAGVKTIAPTSTLPAIPITGR